jgi:hypothetical protein
MDVNITPGPISNKGVKLVPHWILGILYDQLALIHRVCVANDIKYWLISGTLLGQVRGAFLQKRESQAKSTTALPTTLKYYPSIIPWDDDIDVGIDKKDMDRLRTALTVEAAKHNYLVWNSVHGLKLFCRDNEGIGSDVFIYEQLHNNPENPQHTSLSAYTGYVWCLASKQSRAAWPRDYFLDDELTTLQKVPFGALSVYIPKSPTRYLFRLYGDDCMEVGRLDFNHLENKKHENAGIAFTL